MSSHKYVDIEVLSYAVQQLGTKINSVFLKKTDIQANPTLSGSEIDVTALKIGDDIYKFTSSVPDDTYVEINQGADNKDKILVVGNDGKLTLTTDLTDINNKIGSTALPTTDKTITGSIAELYNKSGGTITIIKQDTPDKNCIATYIVKQDGTEVGRINIPKDSDVITLKSDVNTLKSNVSSMQTTLNTVKTTANSAIQGVKLNGVELSKDGSKKVNIDLSNYYTKDEIDIELSTSISAQKVTYSNTVSKLTSKNVQGAIDEIENRVDAIEGWDKIDEAFEIQYENKTSGMTATNVQQAIDEIDKRLDNWIMDSSNVSYNGKTLDKVLAEYTKALTSLVAKNIGYSGLKSGYAVTNVQDALDMLYQDIKAIVVTNDAIGISYDNTTSGLSGANTQAAIDELATKLGANTSSIAEINKKITEIIQDLSAASEVTFDDTKTALSATNVQEALENLDTLVDNNTSGINTLNTSVSNMNTTIGNHTTSINTLNTNMGKIDINTVDGFKTVDGKLTWNGVEISARDTVYAKDVVYDNKASKLSSTNTQNAIDEINQVVINKNNDIDKKLDDWQDKIDALTVPTATDISYDDSSSKLGSTTVQGAISKLDTSMDSAKTTISTHTTNISNLTTRVKAIEDTPVQTAKTEDYDNTTSGLKATKTQDAIDEVLSKVKSIDEASQINFNNSSTYLSGTNMQSAMEEIANDASKLRFDNSETELDATNVKAALEELEGMVSGGTGSTTYVVKATSFKYTGTGVAPKVLNFDFAPSLVVITNNRNDNSVNFAQAVINYQSPYYMWSFGYGDNNRYNHIGNVAWKDNYCTASLSGGLDKIMNISGIQYTVTYFYKCRIASGGSGGSGGGASTAADVSYDSSTSNLVDVDGVLVQDVQIAIDTLCKAMTFENADNIKYTSDFTSLESKTVSDALDELDNKFNAVDATKAINIEYDNTTSGVDSITVQNAIDRLFDQIEQLMADYYYKKPQILSFTANYDENVIYEKGIAFTDLKLSWTTNKVVVEQYLTDCSPSADARSFLVPITVDDDKTFELTVVDEKGNTDTATISFHFGKNAYWGSANAPANNNGFDLNFCLGLGNKTFIEEIQGEYPFSVTSGQYGYIVYPFSCSVISKGFVDYLRTDAKYITTVNLINESGFTYSYYVYRVCEQTGLGNFTYRIE